MALFTSMFNNPNPYNVPINQIRPPQNQVNISGGLGATSQGDAFEAFSRLVRPYVQQQEETVRAGSLGAQPAYVQRAQLRAGELPPPPPQPITQDDINTAILNMFTRAEDAGTLSRYRGFSQTARRSF